MCVCVHWIVISDNRDFPKYAERFNHKLFKSLRELVPFLEFTNAFFLLFWFIFKVCDTFEGHLEIQKTIPSFTPTEKISTDVFSV